MSKKWLISVMATAMVFTLGLSAACSINPPSSSSSEEPVSSSDSSSTVEGTIKLNASTAKIDVYDTLQLTATLENLEGDVIWSSSKEEVATVDANGLVTAHSAGTVTITATVGDVSASCEVTTVVSEVPPIMTVSDTALNLKKGDSLTVTVSTTWKDKEMENAVYSWYLEDPDKTESDIVSISVSEDGRTATFTGLAHGTETYCVSTYVNGMALVETIVINSVDNDITFEVTNLEKSPKGYKASISLAEAEGHVTSIKPEITVYYQGEAQEVDIEWTPDSEEYAVMDENGVITGLKPGKTTFQAMIEINGKIGLLNITVEVYAPAFEYAVEETIELDLNGDATATLALGELADKLNGTLQEAKIGDTVFAAASYADGVISVDKASIGNVYGDATVTAIFNIMKGDVVASIEKVSIPVKTYRSISTAAELNKLEEYVQMNGTSAYGDFRLTADIDMQGADILGVGKWSGSAWTHVWKGSFDGQGHVIANAVMPGGNDGLFSCTGNDAVIKNIVFVNAEVKNESGLIATSHDGTAVIENVFVHGKLTTASGGQNWAPAALLVAKNSGIIRNCFAVLTDTTTTNYGGMIAGFNKLNGVTENCIAINISGKLIHLAGTESVKIPSQSENCGLSSKAYTSISDYYTEADDSEFNVWAKGLLEKYLKPLEEAGVQITAPKAEVAKNGSTQLNVVNPGYLISWALKEEVTGVSIDENGLVSATADAQDGATFTVVATGAFGTKCEFTMTVVKETVAVTLDSTEYDASRNTGAPVNVSSVSEGTLTLRHVAVAGVMIEGATMDNGVVTVPNAYLVDGEKANDVTISVTDGDKIYEISVPVVKITKVIMDKADLDWFATESAKSQNKYYVLGADIEYTGVYTASGAWMNNILDGRGHTINNFVTSTGLILGGGEPSNSPAARDATIIRNINFTNAKTTISGKAIIVDAGGFTLKNLYVSVAADAVDKTYALWRDHYGNSYVYGVVVEYLGKTASSTFATCHDDRGIINGLYAINVAAWDQGGGSDWKEGVNPGYKVDIESLFASWADFQENTNATKFFTNDFWTLVNGAPVPKTLSIAIKNTENSIPAGTDYKVNFPGYASISINEVEGVTLNGNVISVADGVAGGTKVVVTLKNAITGEESTKELTVLSNMVINATELDFELTNETVSTAKLTEETLTDVSITWNGGALAGATFENGVLTLSNAAFGKGTSDWGHQTIVVTGTTDKGMVTINVPVLAYKAVTDLKSLESVGYVTKNGTDNFRTNVYGYFKLTADFDATGWAGNGTYDNTYKGSNFVLHGTIDGQNHVISNYSASTNRGIIFDNQGVIKNLILKNAQATGNSGIVVTSNTAGGRVENVYVEGKLNATGANWCAASLIVAKNDANSVIENCVTVFMGASTYDVIYQGLIAGYNNGTMKNNVAINLTANTYYMAPRKTSAAADSAAEYAGETNTLYTNVADYAASENWAKDLVAVMEPAKIVLSAGTTELAVGSAVQLKAVDKTWVKAWALKEEVAGVSVDANGIVTAADTTAEGVTVTVIATGIFGNTSEYTLTTVKYLETVQSSLAGFEYDASRNTGAPVDVSSVSEKELTLSVVKVGGEIISGATMENGVVTVPNAALVDGVAANKVIVTVTDGDYNYEVSVDVVKITMVIKTVADLDNWTTAAYAADSAVGFWGGYFVLGNNISYNKAMTHWNTYAILGNLGVSARNGKNCGFRGVFDGRGYVIDGVEVNGYASGFFGYAINNATIKNIAFTNARNFSGTSFLGGAGGCAATIENIYVQMTMGLGSTTNNDKTGVLPDTYGETRVKDVFADVTMANGAAAHSGVKGFFYHKAFENHSGVYVAGISPLDYAMIGCGCCEDKSLNVNGAYVDRAAMLAATDWQAEVATWDSSFWTTDAAGLPIPVSVKNLIDESTIAAPATKVAAGSTLQLSNPYATAWAVAEGAPEGVSVDQNGLLTVAEGATGSVTVNAILRDGSVKSIEISILVTENVTLDETKGDLRNAKSVSVDLTSYNITETIILPEGATFADGILTIPTGTTTSNWGKFTVTATLVASNTTYNFTIPVFAYVSISKVADFDDMHKFAVTAGKDIYGTGQDYYAYFVMTNDIDMTGSTFKTMGAAYWSGSLGCWSHQFAGIFDGQGYAIKNWAPTGSNGGLFVQINKGAVVKNIAFLNMTNNQGATVATCNYGTVENVFVETNIVHGGPANIPVGGIISKNAGTIKNCVVIVTGAPDPTANYGGMIAGRHENGAAGVTENCVAVNLSGKTMHAVNEFDSGTNNKLTSNATDKASESDLVFTSWTDYVNAETTIDNWAIEYVKAFEAAQIAITASNTDVVIGNSLQLSVVNSAYVKSWTLKEEVAGVSVSADGIVSVSSEATPNTTFTVVTTGYTGATAEITLNIAAFAKDEVSTTIKAQEVDASKAESVSLSVVGGIETIEKLYNVKVNGVEVEGATFEGKNVTVPVSLLVDGETANEVTFKAETATTIYTVSASIVKITKIINNSEDLNAFATLSATYPAGYFVVGQDFTYEGEYSSTNTTAFTGVFDGRGHVITNFTAKTALILTCGGSSATAGTVKNVILVNAVQKTSGTSILIKQNGGLMQNIYVSFSADTANETRGLSQNMYGTAKFQDVMVVYADASKTAHVVYEFHPGRGIPQGVYAIGVDAFAAKVQAAKDWATDIYGVYADRAAMIAATDWQAEFATWNTDFWTTDADGLPIAKALV